MTNFLLVPMFDTIQKFMTDLIIEVEIDQETLDVIINSDLV